jgi:hypothetical protein
LHRDDWVLSALGAVVIAALVVMIIALGFALRSTGDDAQTEVQSTGTPTFDAVAFNNAVRSEQARYLARLTPSPSPTPTPRNETYGKTCTRDQVGQVRIGDNGATGWNLITYDLYNNSNLGCDLPVAIQLMGFDLEGNVLFSNSASGRCLREALICNDRASPLYPLEKVPADHKPAPGSLLVTVQWYRCDFQCSYWTIDRLDLRFEGGLTISLPGLRVPVDHDVSIGAFGWVNR